MYFKNLKIINIMFIFLLQLKYGIGLIHPNSFIHNNPKLSIKTIEYLTDKLPMLDTFGHKNLEFNQKVVPYILNSDLPNYIKTESVTGLIRFSQYGDNFGGWILDNYLKIITYLVNCL